MFTYLESCSFSSLVPTYLPDEFLKTFLQIHIEIEKLLAVKCVLHPCGRAGKEPKLDREPSTVCFT